MKCSCAVFPKTLHYESPAHGGWGLVRMAGLLPESYMLFYTPAACGRHSSLGALTNGIKDKVSYLFLSEEEIVSGHYENEIPPAVDKLFRILGKRPRALLLFGGCIDDFLGTDYDVLKEKLERLYPDVRVCCCHMNPIQLDTKSPPGVSLFTNIYSMLERREKNPHQITFLGNNVVPNKDSEIWKVLEAYEVEAKMLPALKSFDEFLSLSESSLNLVLSPRVMQSARKQEKTLGIPYMVQIPTYNVDELERFYKTFQERLETITGIKSDFDVSPYKERAINALKECSKAFKGIGVTIDFQAVYRPFTLAKVLLDYGFDVKMVASDGVSAFEKSSFEYLRENYPDLEVVNPLDHDAPKYKERYLKDTFSIGFDAAFMTGSEHLVDVQEDDDLFGFDGVERLMRRMLEEKDKRVDVLEVIREAKLVI